MRDLGAARRRRGCAAPSADRARTPPSSSASPGRTRTRAAAAPIEPEQHRADDRRARARHAGNQRQHLARADAERARQRRVIGVQHGRRAAATARPTSMHDAADDEADRDDRGRRVQHALHVAREEQRAGDQRPAGTRRESSPRSAARPGRTAAPSTTRTILARYSHMTARIEPSWIITVKTPPGSSKPRAGARRAAGARSTTRAGTR